MHANCVRRTLWSYRSHVWICQTKYSMYLYDSGSMYCRKKRNGSWQKFWKERRSRNHKFSQNDTSDNRNAGKERGEVDVTFNRSHAQRLNIHLICQNWNRLRTQYQQWKWNSSLKIRTSMSRSMFIDDNFVTSASNLKWLISIFTLASPISHLYYRSLWNLGVVDSK